VDVGSNSMITSKPSPTGPSASTALAWEGYGPVGDGYEVIIEFDPTST